MVQINIIEIQSLKEICKQLSHDIRNPLSRIQILSQVLLEDIDKLPNESQIYIEMISSASKEILNALEDIMKTI